jgi:gliding motility-associated-like protein
MSNSDLCYTVDNGAVYIKAMDECYPITMPVFFSPDGDGINDYFRIEGLEHYLGYEITIYDRYGKEVFRGGAGKIDYPSSLGWDGKYLGNDLPSGDYWYQMTFTEIPTKVGYFALKRKKE